ADDAIAAFCQRRDIPCHRGSENDVLDRFHQAALAFHADALARITADCPLIDPGVIDLVIAKYQEGGWDYVSNTLSETFPDGLDVEVFSAAALAQAWRETKVPTHREHVTPYLRDKDRFRVGEVSSDISRSEARGRWTVDGPNDLEFVRQVFAALGQ